MIFSIIILTYITSEVSAANSNTSSGNNIALKSTNYQVDTQNNNEISSSQSFPNNSANINITNDFKNAYNPGYPNPGNEISQSDYCNWAWNDINITNNGPDDTNVTIADNGSKGFVYYDPSIGWKGYVRFNNGSGWIWDNNFNVTTGLGTYDIANGDSYQIAILGYINQTGNITNTVNEISQDVYTPDPYPSANATLTIPKAAIIKLNEGFRDSLNGSTISDGNYLDWVYAVATTTNNGPDTANVIYQSESSGFTPNGTYYVSYDYGTTWIKNDGSYNIITGIWSIQLPSNSTYLLAIYGQITQPANINNTITEISQDVYNPYGPDNTVPKCLIVFDDGNVAQYSIAFKYMQTKGILGTDYVIGYNLGQSGVETLADIQEMNAAGWIIGNHTYDHLILPELTDQEINSEISEEIDFLIDNGLPNGAHDLAYPGGYSDQDVYNIMKALGIQTGRTTVGSSISNLNALDLYQIPAYTIINTTSVTSVEGYVNDAMTSDSTVVILFHDLVSSNAAEYQYLTSDFQNIIDYISNCGIDCITINDLYQDAAIAPINIPTNGSEYNNLSTSNGYASAVASVQPEADIQINYTVSNNTPKYHDPLTLTITVQNNGPNNAENVTVGDWLGNSNLTYVSDDSNESYNPITGIWTVGSLENGASETLNINTIVAMENVTIINAATYNSGLTYDPNPDNNYQILNLTVPPQPLVESIDPANNAINILDNKVIKIKFNGDIKAGTLWIELKDNSGNLTSISPSISGNILTINHSALFNNGKYYLSLHTGSITDMVGNPLALWSSSFTVDSIPPTVKTINPVRNAVNIPANQIIKITFSESIKARNMDIVLTNSKGIATLITTSISGNVLTINHKALLTNGNYSLTLHTSSVTDLAGNNLALWGSSFNVYSIPPTVEVIIPTKNAVNVPINQVIKITFSEPIKAGNMDFELKTSSGKEVKFTKKISGNTLSIKPTTYLSKGLKYTIVLHTGSVTGLAGNYLTPYSSTFTTV